MDRDSGAEEFYLDDYENLLEAKNSMLDFLAGIDSDGIEHLKSRIKAPSSVIEKLKKRGYEPCAEEAFLHLKDLVGIRIICRFWNDVFTIAEILETSEHFRLVESKNYIDSPKANGYRSYHVIVEVKVGERFIPVELQIRTISQDSWASLEHKMKYKKDIAHQQMIQSELKRIADEMASTDVCMQTIKELIMEETG